MGLEVRVGVEVAVVLEIAVVITVVLDWRPHDQRFMTWRRLCDCLGVCTAWLRMCPCKCRALTLYRVSVSGCCYGCHCFPVLSSCVSYPLSVCLSYCRSVCLSFCLSVCLSVRPFGCLASSTRPFHAADPHNCTTPPSQNQGTPLARPLVPDDRESFEPSPSAKSSKDFTEKLSGPRAWFWAGMELETAAVKKRRGMPRC